MPQAALKLSTTTSAQFLYWAGVRSRFDRHGELEVAWRDGRRAVHRDDEIALELLRDHLASAARRISARAGAENVVALKAGRRRDRPGG